MTQMRVVSLGEVARLQAGVTFPPDLQGRSAGKYPFAKVGDISRGGRSGEPILSTANHFVDDHDLARLRADPIPAGSVLFAKIGEAIRANHRVIAGQDMLIDNNAMAAIPKSPIDARYLYHFLRTVDFYRLASSTTVPALRKTELERLPVPLPSGTEQRRIAAILDQAEALRAKRRAALAKLDTLTQSIFLEMFGDPVANPKNWPTTALGGLLEEIRNGANVEQLDDLAGWPVTRIETIADGRIDTSRVRWTHPDDTLIPKYRMHEGDILFSHINSVAHIGKTALYEGTPPLLIHGINLLRLRPRHATVDAKWLLQTLRHGSTRLYFQTRCKRAVNQASLNQGDVCNLLVRLPPLELQQKFARRVKSIERLKMSHNASLAKMDDLFASLQQRAFRGEL